MIRLRRTTVVLTLLNVGLSVLWVRVWSHGQARIREPERVEVSPLKLSDLSALDSNPMHSVEVATIRDQALFYATRSFYQPPAKPQELSPPNYELAGTMRLVAGTRLAFLKSRADQSSRTVHVGDELDGWTVRAVESDRVVLVQLEQTFELANVKTQHASGLIRTSRPVRSVQTGIRRLGGGIESTTPAPNPVASAKFSAPRVFVPPTPIGK